MAYMAWFVFGSLVATAVYVHRTCMSKLGPNSEDNTVRVYPANPNAASATAEPLQPPVLAVILGWGGSTSRQLRRLVAHFTDVLQCPVATYINPMTGFLHNALDDTYVIELLKEIQKQVGSSSSSNTASGFVLYVHSNNGAFVFVDLKRHLQDPSSPFYPLRLQLRGVVYDSAPALLEEAGAGDGPVGAAVAALKRAAKYTFPCVAIILGRAQYVHWFWTPAVVLWFITYRAVFQVWTRLTSSGATNVKSAEEVDLRVRLAKGLRKQVFPVPHLFLYSTGDRLLPARYIEEYIAAMRAYQPALPHIQTHDFKTTGHVQHFLRQTQEYTQQLGSFLRLAQRTDSTRKTISAAQKL